MSTLRNLVSEMSQENESIEKNCQAVKEGLELELRSVERARQLDQERIAQLQVY